LSGSAAGRAVGVAIAIAIAAIAAIATIATTTWGPVLAAELVQEVGILAVHLLPATTRRLRRTRPAATSAVVPGRTAAAAAAAAATATSLHFVPVTVHLLLLLLDIQAPRCVGSSAATSAAFLSPGQLPHFVLEVVLVVTQRTVDHGKFAQLHALPLVFRILLGL